MYLGLQQMIHMFVSVMCTNRGGGVCESNGDRAAVRRQLCGVKRTRDVTLRRKGRPIALKTHFPASHGFLASLHASRVGGTKRRETTQVRDARIPFNRPEKDPMCDLLEGNLNGIGCKT